MEEVEQENRGWGDRDRGRGVEVPGEDKVGTVPALRGLSDQQEVWHHQAWQGGGHTHSQTVGFVVHVHGGPLIGHLGGQGEGLGPLLSVVLPQNPQSEPLSP